MQDLCNEMASGAPSLWLPWDRKLEMSMGRTTFLPLPTFVYQVCKPAGLVCLPISFI